MTSVGLVALVLYLEAGGESPEGREAVATVICNRALERNSTLYDVVMEPKQFSCLNDGVITASIRMLKRTTMSRDEAQAYAECYELAKFLCSGYFVPQGRWTHYYAGTTVPGWAAGKPSEKIGNQTFLRG